MVIAIATSVDVTLTAIGPLGVIGPLEVVTVPVTGITLASTLTIATLTSLAGMEIRGISFKVRQRQKQDTNEGHVYMHGWDKENINKPQELGTKLKAEDMPWCGR